MSVFSPLITSKVDFGTKNSNQRKNKVVRITPHHTAGTSSATATAKSHLNSNRASANYYISDDSIVGGVSEDRRAWTTGTGNNVNTNDHMAITFEVSNNKLGDPHSGKGWTISDKSYRSLVRLSADICKRYGIFPHYDGTKNGTITMHKQFAATACPAEMLEGLITSGQFERDILAEMNGVPSIQVPKQEAKVLWRVQTGAFKNKANAETYMNDLKAKGFDAFVKKEGQYFKVQVGAFANKSNATALLAKLSKAGYGGFLTVGV